MEKKKGKDEKNNMVAGRGNVLRNTLAVIFTLIIGVCLSVVIMLYSGRLFLDEYEKDMVNGLKGTVSQYKADLKRGELYDSSTHEIVEDMMGYMTLYLDKHGMNKKTFEALDVTMGGYMHYFIFNGSLDHDNKVANGSFLYRENKSDFSECSKEELYEIINAGLYYIDSEGYYVRSREINSGYLISKYRCENIFTTESALKAYSDDSDEFICRVNEETGIIEDSCETDYIGTSYFEYLGRDSLEFIPEYDCETIYRLDKNYSLVGKSESINGEVFVSVVPMEILIPSIVRNSLLGVVLCWCFIITILIYMIRFSRDAYLEDKEVEFVRVFKNRYVDAHIISHIGGLTLYAVILVILSMLYVQTMTNYSSQNVNAKADLKGLENHIELNTLNAEAMEKDFFECARILTELISNYYVAFPDECSNESLKEFTRYMPTISRITFFDGRGVASFDSQGVADIVLSKGEDNLENRFWYILEGQSDLEYFPSKWGEDNGYYVATERQGTKGLVRICIDGTLYNRFMEDESIADYIITTNMGASERGYIDKDAPETIYWSQSGQSDFKEITNTLSENVLTQGYSGMTRIQGKRQIINVRETDDLYLLCGKSTAYLAGTQSYREYFHICIFMFLQYSFFLLLGIRKKSFVESTAACSIDKTLKFEEIVRRRTMDKSFRGISLWMILVSLLMIAITLIIDSVYGHTSILSYLMGSQWPKGFNLFSLTMILMMILAITIGGKIFETVVIFFTQNMGPRGVTIGKMACSLIKFAALLIIIISSMVYLGANLNGLLASAGIVGAVLTLCANQTINDLVSGLMIIYENSINVGDWITVDDFRGEVIEIGVRVTKVSAMGDVKIVNNSDLRTFMIMCKEKHGAYATVDIAYKEDVLEVLKLLRSKEEYFRQEIPEIDEGPGFDGIVALGDSGVTIRMWAIGHRDDIGIISRDMLRLTKEIFDENGIEIPFNQVTIHNAD